VGDAKSQVTTYAYDNMDRLLTRKDALNRTESYQYDLAGNLTTFTDRKNQQAAFQYDALNRRTQATYADATTTFTYDTVGRLVKASDTAPGAGTIDLAYDILDRLVRETTGQGVVGYQYDVLGRRTQMIANGQQPTTYQYDAASRLTRVAQGALFASLGYDNINRRTSLGYSNDTITAYAYDLASRLTNITHNGPSGIIDALTYTYDAAGNRSSVLRSNGTATLLPDPVPSASYDAANEQTQFAGGALTYDANGNLISDGVNTYQWDARNRLSGISGSVAASFVYDPLGRRFGKTINGVTTQFVYDRLNIVQETNGSAVTGTFLSHLRLDDVFLRSDAAGTSTFLQDALGSTVALSDATGASQIQYTYAPFGATAQSGAATTNSIKFTGREDDGTGLYYYRARYYHPRLQRFIIEDPLGFRGGINKYGYVGNDPVNGLDPTGTTNSFEHMFDSIFSFLFLTDLRGAALTVLNDPFFFITNPWTDVGTQGTTATDTNIHSMAGTVNNQLQTCQQALEGAAQIIAFSMNSGNVGQALHTGEDWATPSHGGLPWLGGRKGPIPDKDHLRGDWLDFSRINFSNRIHNDSWIMNNLPNGGQPITPNQVLSNMRGGHC
jgi:RHS repeat-associated protein